MDLESIKMVTDIAVNLIVIGGAVIGIFWLREISKKQEDSVFSYLARLKVHIQYLYDVMEKHQTIIMDRLVSENNRRSVSPPKSVFIDDIIEQFAIHADETLTFLMGANDQIPASVDWREKSDIFIELLEDCSRMKNNLYAKWVGDEDYSVAQKNYYKCHMDNMKMMLADIEERQKKSVRKLFWSEWILRRIKVGMQEKSYRKKILW